jgi:hypothetical protein
MELLTRLLGGPRRALIVGTNEEALAVEKLLRAGGLSVVGFYPVGRSPAPDFPQDRLISNDVALVQIARKLNVSEIIVAIEDEPAGGMPLSELLECKLAGITVLDLASYFERALGQVRLDSLRANSLVFGAGFRQGVSRTIIKRVFDVVIASALLLCALRSSY